MNGGSSGNGSNSGPFRALGIPGLGPRFDWGPANFDVRNVVHFSGGYELPIGKGMKYLNQGGITNVVLGGWAVNWIVTAQGGQPVDFGCPTGTATGTGCRSVLVKGQSLQKGVKIHQVGGQPRPFWFNNLPTTDLPVYLSAAYFRIADRKFYVPVSVVVPGSQIPFTHNNDQDRATLDVLGIVTDPEKRPVGQIRDTVKLALNTSQLVQRKNVQYNTGFVLPPGTYHLKFVVRENQSGRLGSFETDLTVPDLKSVPVKMSSIVLANQLQPNNKRKSDNPLVRDGSEVIPSVTHVFSAGQHLYFYYEVYDPARAAANAGAPANDRNSPAIHLLTNVAFFRGNTKAYETPLVESEQLNAPDRKAAVFQLDVPLTQLKPGFYTCQVNVIDDAAGQFRFPRVALLVRQ